jgi:hypothetical protein
MRIEMPSTMTMMRISSTKWRVTKSLEQFGCKVVKQTDKFWGKVIVTPSPPEWCYNQWIFLVLVFCKFWFDKNLEKWFSVSVKWVFSQQKNLIQKQIEKKKKLVAINTVMTKRFQSPVPHVNKDDDDDGGKLSCWRGGGWGAATGKGAFTLGVKDSSIKSPNTKLII